MILILKSSLGVVMDMASLDWGKSMDREAQK